jgi:hypothetical protein
MPKRFRKTPDQGAKAAGGDKGREDVVGDIATRLSSLLLQDNQKNADSQSGRRETFLRKAQRVGCTDEIRKESHHEK